MEIIPRMLAVSNLVITCQHPKFCKSCDIIKPRDLGVRENKAKSLITQINLQLRHSLIHASKIATF